MMNELNSIKTEILHSIQQRNYTQLEHYWLKYIESDIFERDFIEKIAGQFIKSSTTAKLTELFELLMMEYSENRNYIGVLECGRILAKYKSLPDNLSEILIISIREIYKDNPNLNKYILYSGIESGVNLQDSFNKLDKYFYCDVGQIFRHNTWGLGVVKELDLIQEQVMLYLDNKGEHWFSIDGIYQYLTKIPDGHYLAIKMKSLNLLKSMSNEQPVELVKLLIKSFQNKISVAELKKELTDGIIESKDWSKWWAKTKLLLKSDFYIDLSDGVKGQISIRSEARPLDDEILEKIKQAQFIDEINQYIREYVKNIKLYSQADKIARIIYDKLTDSYSRLNESEIDKKILHYYSYELLKKSAKTDLLEIPISEKELIASITDFPELLIKLSQTDYAERILDSLLRENPVQWQDIFYQLLPHVNPKLAEKILNKFLSAGLNNKFESGINQLLAGMESNPETYLWSVQQILESKWNNSVFQESHYEILLELLELLESLNNRRLLNESEKKYKTAIISKARKMLEKNDFQLIRDILLGLSRDDAIHLLNSLRSNSGLSELFKTSAEYAIAKIRPDLEKEEKKGHEPMESRREHYCTLEAYDRQNQIYQKLVTIDIPENSKDIAIARAHGDLRENAEYQSAKQKQKVLFKQVDELRDLLNRVRIMDIDKVGTERVAFGTKVNLENMNKECMEQYAILGIWEAEPAKNIISYLSPLGAAILGKNIGQIVEIELPEGKNKYKIISIEKIL